MPIIPASKIPVKYQSFSWEKSMKLQNFQKFLLGTFSFSFWLVCSKNKLNSTTVFQNCFRYHKCALANLQGLICKKQEVSAIPCVILEYISWCQQWMSFNDVWIKWLFWLTKLVTVAAAKDVIHWMYYLKNNCKATCHKSLMCSWLQISTFWKLGYPKGNQRTKWFLQPWLPSYYCCCSNF